MNLDFSNLHTSVRATTSITTNILDEYVKRDELGTMAFQDDVTEGDANIYGRTGVGDERWTTSDSSSERNNFYYGSAISDAISQELMEEFEDSAF